MNLPILNTLNGDFARYTTNLSTCDDKPTNSSHSQLRSKCELTCTKQHSNSDSSSKSSHIIHSSKITNGIRCDCSSKSNSVQHGHCSKSSNLLNNCQCSKQTNDNFEWLDSSEASTKCNINCIYPETSESFDL